MLKLPERPDFPTLLGGIAMLPSCAVGGRQLRFEYKDANENEFFQDGPEFACASLNPNSEVALGSAPAPGDVFRALAENFVRTEYSASFA